MKHDADSSTLRSNGRKFDENREIICELGIMKNSSISGSALFQIGNTKVAAFINGPHQVSVFLISNFALYRSLKEEEQTMLTLESRWEFSTLDSFRLILVPWTIDLTSKRISKFYF